MNAMFRPGVLGLLLLACLPLQAGQLTVAPLRMHITQTQPNATFSLSNGSSRDGFYQLQLFAWEEVDGESRFRQQQDLVVTPPVTLIPANGQQVVRIVRQRPTDADKELSYRLIISEVPDTENEAGAKLRVLLRLSVPVFAGDKDQSPVLIATRNENGIVIHNKGDAHARLSDAHLQTDNGEDILVQRGLVGYVLPDGQLSLPLESVTLPTGSALSFKLNGKPFLLPVEDQP
ncbi:hypothetical protein Q670_08210 [Alcanivorax sp. P2S70]|uniref:fimbrial biogenesis chaperone n=1 Tax=Alcanivorax TaxID=59753 RepID=UPI0003B2F087|nr:fimbria/pilus periplasmic chaperone [Alcanivorax sp. P2S70]ERP93023.1 hypothetical protein Q670_08210 [Alcanivorax sp. P2S70]|tara:strand:- start:1668 stop:2363 length:696 start_codon:yes stop_codon:yes gene_type:complete